jgi:hypothetical protein
MDHSIPIFPTAVKIPFQCNTVRSKIRYALRLEYIGIFQTCNDARGHHFQQHLQVHNDFPNADLQKVFGNKIKRFRPVHS